MEFDIMVQQNLHNEKCTEKRQGNYVTHEPYKKINRQNFQKQNEKDNQNDRCH